jgi:hypothetical protein
MPHSGKLSISKATGAEMNDQNSRFQVNRVGNQENDEGLVPPDPLDGLSPHQYTYVYDTRYAKSLGQLTREALPKLDNYRDLMSVHAAPRPTLDDLHHATYMEKVSIFSIRFGCMNGDGFFVLLLCLK